MKLDDTTKIVSLVSVIVGVMMSVAGYFANQKLTSLNNDLAALKQKDMGMEVAEKEELKSARLSAEFSLPLARTFAKVYNGSDHKLFYIQIPEALVSEFGAVLPEWAGRKGLMTGNACTTEGLKNRQVVTLIVKNTGYADAVDVVIKVKRKKSPHTNPREAWREFPKGSDRGYGELWSASDGWIPDEMKISELRGRISPEADRKEVHVVLASVAGRDGLFGTIIVPIELSWADRITKQVRTRTIDESLISVVRSALFGAEIGTAGSACN